MSDTLTVAAGPGRSRKKWLFASAAVVAVLALSAFWLARPQHAAQPGPAGQPTPVVTAAVTQHPVPIERDGLGHVQALNTVTVHSQVAGQIVKVAYTEGQTLHQGDLLVQIDPRTFQATLEEANAALTRDKAHLANAEANLGRYQPLEKKGYASDQQMETQRAKVAQMEATLQFDQAAIDRAKTELDYTTITSPISGVAGLRLIDQGNIVQADQGQPLVTIAQIQPIAMLFTLPQADLTDIQMVVGASGDPSNLAVEAWSQDGTTLLDRGHLSVINNEIDSASGTVTLKAEFPNPRRLLWPGEFVQARLILRTDTDAITVPAAAIQRGPAGDFAWVVRPDNTAEERPVKIGQLQHGTALVTDGLKAGETVVTDGQYALRPGVQVSRQTTGGAATAGAMQLKNAETDRLGIQP
jgi:membrane fusion protein, multidrug efflux system